MQYTIATSSAQANLGVVRRAIDDVDPAAIVDVDSTGGIVRISTVIGGPELLALLNGAGYPLNIDALEQVPSQCCGGCSG